MVVQTTGKCTHNDCTLPSPLFPLLLRLPVLCPFLFSPLAVPRAIARFCFLRRVSTKFRPRSQDSLASSLALFVASGVREDSPLEGQRIEGPRALPLRAAGHHCEGLADSAVIVAWWVLCV